ncbi:MAG: DMT family transporter [Planctomycetota bacterium]
MTPPVQSTAGDLLGSQFVGPGAAVLTSLLWVLTSLFFTTAGRRIPVTVVNTVRIALAIILLAATHQLVYGTIWPEIGTQRQLLALALSGLIGLSLCDQALFTAFVDIGPRRALLCMTTSPIFAVFFGGVFLGERVVATAYVAIAVTIMGIVWVVTERGDGDVVAEDPSSASQRLVARGLVLAFVASVSQAAGGMLSKVGMGVGSLPEAEQLSPQSATLVRMLFGLFGMAPIVLIYVVMARRNATAETTERRWSTGLALTACGTVVGPFLGVWMSLVAFKHSPLAVAQTLCSLSPVLILPFSRYILRERVTRRAVLGAVVALVGAAALAFAELLHGWIFTAGSVSG